MERIGFKHGRTPKRFVIYDSRDRFGFEGDYNVYKDWCANEGYKPKMRDTQHFRKFLKIFEQQNRKILFSNLCWSSMTMPFVMTGDTSDWDGKSLIKCRAFRSENLQLKYTSKDGVNIYGYENTAIRKAIMSIAEHNDTEDFMIEFMNNIIYLHAYRKDGNEVVLELHPLNKIGEKILVNSYINMTEYVCQKNHLRVVHTFDIDF